MARKKPSYYHRKQAIESAWLIASIVVFGSFAGALTVGIFWTGLR